MGISLSRLDSASRALSPPDGALAVEPPEGGIGLEPWEGDFDAAFFSSGTGVPAPLEAGASSAAFDCAAEGGMYSWTGGVDDGVAGGVDCELPGRVAD